jgi:hypothetical protein
MVAYTCHPATAVSLKYEDHGSGWSRQKVRPYLQNNQKRKDWRRGSSSRVPASQVQSSEFKLISGKKPKKP